MAEKYILVVDDEMAMRKNVIDVLSGRGYRCTGAVSAEEAFALAAEETPKLIILDINLPGQDGLSALVEFKKLCADVPVILFTAYGTSERAIEAMKSGAYDYIEKPFELDEFLLIVERSLEFSSLVGEVRELRDKVSAQDTANEQLIGASKAMKDIFKTIGRLSSSDATVLIEGASGTGKELVADAIQRHSLRKDRPFIKVNCGGLSESILESEIFGHEKGAFTGAISQRQGRFELANRGTIFLDEVNNMPASLQVKLLRLLQNQTYYRVGGEVPVKTDVRVIAASNKDLLKEVEAGNFRSDLFYRLNVVTIKLPPLTERVTDIPVLVKHFLKKYSPNEELVVPFEEMQKLLSYAWPGNIRELENVIQRAVVLQQKGVIKLDALGAQPSGPGISQFILEELSAGRGMRAIIATIEKELIGSALQQTRWNRTKTAELLQIHRRLLYTKMIEYGLTKKNS